MKSSDAEQLLRSFDEFINKETDLLPFSSDKGFSGIRIDSKNFHELSLFGEEKPLLAIDGGNAQILSGPNFSLHFMRIAAVSYQQKQRALQSVSEFICFIEAKENNGVLHYTVSFFGDAPFSEPLGFDSQTITLDGERYSTEMEHIAGMIRRRAELLYAKRIVEESDSLMVAIDGSIKAKTKEEYNVLKDLLDAARKKEMMVGFLSKTCRLLTRSASGLSSALQDRGPKSSWLYYPVFEVSNEYYLGEMCFVRLHSSSKHVFRLEIDSACKEKLQDYVRILSSYSSDPLFFGYPYPLLAADSFARISKKDEEYARALLLSKVKNKERLSYLLSSVDAHDVLDSISF